LTRMVENQLKQPRSPLGDGRELRIKLFVERSTKVG